jgi:hypothetical protein
MGAPGFFALPSLLLELGFQLFDASLHGRQFVDHFFL